MDGRFTRLTVAELLDELGRDTRVPGAGPAAALVAATAASLAAMAARSSSGWPDAAGAAAQAELLRTRAIELADEDAVVVEAFVAARAGAGENNSEARDFKLGLVLERAADVPLAIAETACDAALLAAEVASRCDGDVRADAAAAAALALGATRAAAHLVEVNLVAHAEDVRVLRARSLVRTVEAAAREVATAETLRTAG